MINFLAYSLLATTSAAVQTPSVQMTPCDLGDQYRFAQADCKIQLSNSGDRPVRISGIAAMRTVGGDRAGVSEVVIAPHSATYVPVSVVQDFGSGLVNHYFVATSDEPGAPRYQLVARAFVNTVLDDTNPHLDFGTVDADGPMPKKSIKFTSREAPGLRIERIVSAPAHLDVTIGRDGHSLEVQPKPGISWGLHEDIVEFALNTPQQKRESIRVRMDVHGAVVPALNPVDIGLARQGQAKETIVRLTSKNGEEFKVGHVTLQGLDGSTQILPCANHEKGCALLKLTLNAGQPIGEVKGIALVELPEYKNTLPVFIWGMLVKPGTQVRTLDKTDQDSSLTDALNEQTTAQRSVSIQDAIKTAVTAPVDQAPPPGVGPLLKWNTANEQGVHGYVIFRAESEDGAFERVSKETIPTQNPDGSSSSYQWRDSSVQAGKTYWYEIGIVYNNGKKDLLTGPQKVVAK